MTQRSRSRVASTSGTRRWNRRLAVAALLCLGLPAGLLAQTQTFVAPRARVENVVVNREGTTFTVTYDLVPTDEAARNAVFEVLLEVVLDDGSLFRPVSVTGDMGRDHKITPGTGKKISWNSSRDVDNQGYDKFEFHVRIVSANLVESERQPADPSVTPPAETPPASLAGAWLGTYVGYPAHLEIRTEGGGAFDGLLHVVTDPGKPATLLEIAGTLILGGQGIEFRETTVVDKGAVRSWNLGSASGRFGPDRSGMSGSGTDQRTTYQWSFNRVTTSGFDAGETWTGEYAGEPARLLVERRESTSWSGRLQVTTRDGRPPTDLRVEGTFAGGAVQIRETELVDIGSAGSWNLGSGSGTLEAGGLQMIGSGNDGNRTYRWFFLRGGLPVR